MIFLFRVFSFCLCYVYCPVNAFFMVREYSLQALDAVNSVVSVRVLDHGDLAAVINVTFKDTSITDVNAKFFLSSVQQGFELSSALSRALHVILGDDVSCTRIGFTDFSDNF